MAVTDIPDIPPRIKMACDLERALTKLYVHRVITGTERSKARRRLFKLFPEFG